MKTTTLIAIFFICFSFTTNCVKDNEIITNPLLLVGVDNGNFNINNAHFSAGDKSIDIDNDSKFDVNFWTYTTIAPSGYSYSSGIMLLDSLFQLAITIDSISPEIINYNDTILNITRWSYVSERNTKYFLLAKINAFWNINSYYDYSYWLNNEAFICLRKEDDNGNFNYGWIKINVDTYNSYNILEYAFSK